MRIRRSHSNRGMAFETLINHSNMLYERKLMAVINKRPTPVKIMDRNGSRITGFLEKPSTVDYDGHYRQRGISFEAKSIADGDRFPLKNLEQHQYNYLDKCHNVGNAISFVLVEFQARRRTFLIPFPVLRQFWIRRAEGDSKRGTQSIHISEMEREGFEVRSGRVPLDYLAVVDQVWGIKGAG